MSACRRTLAGWSVACLTASLVLVGCTSESRPNENTPSARTATIGTDRRVEITSLGLSFTLPKTFDIEEDPDLVFLASSAAFPAILSLAVEEASITEHDAEAGESLETTSIDGAEALIVTNAEVGELPPGVVSNELLVSNGERSFSLIFSSPAEALDEVWEPFVASLSIR